MKCWLLYQMIGLLAMEFKALGLKLKVDVTPLEGIPNDPQLKNRVIGGEAVKPHTMPWQVGLTLKGDPYIQAGAVIICPTFVIGAAHEPYSVTPEMEQVVVGAHTKKISREAIRKDVLYRHMMPQYDHETSDYDYALYELAEEDAIELDLKKAFAVYLPTVSDKSKPKTYVISGWGSISGTKIKYTKGLRAAKVTSVPWSKCKQFLWEENKTALTERQLCTFGGSLPHAGVSDSGGPLTWLDRETDRVTLRGIISHGFNETIWPEAPGIYADLKVQEVINWIKKLTKNCPDSTCLRKKKCMTGSQLNVITRRKFYL